jgi:hypothetical protein
MCLVNSGLSPFVRWHQVRKRVGSDQNWPAVRALAVLLVVVLIPFYPVLTGREVFWFFDVALFHHPNYTVLKQALVSHDLSAVIWNPDVGTGFPLWAEGQIGGSYPLNWIMVALFDPLVAYSIGQVVHYLLAAVFTYSYARVLGLQRPSAATTALAFTFSGHLVGAMAANTILRSAVWLPLMFWGVERFAAQRKFVHLAVASVGLAMQVLGGYAATAALGGGATVCYGIFRFMGDTASRSVERTSSQSVCTRILRAIVAVGLIGIIGFALAAVQMIPQIELVAHSERTAVSYEYATTWSLPPFQLGTLIWPLMLHNPVERVVWGLENLGRTAIYVGIVPFVLSVVAIVARRRPRRVTFYRALALLALVLALGRYTPLYRWVYLLPGIRSFRAPSTWGYLLDFSLAVLAGYGMDLLLAQPGLCLGRRLAVLCGALLALTLPILGWQVAVQRWAATGQLVKVLELWRPWMKPGRDPALLLRSVQASADPRHATAFMPIVLLITAAGWLALRCTRLSPKIWAWCGVGLAAVDLIFFAAAIRKTQTTSYSVAQVRPWVTEVLDDQPDIQRAAVTWSLYSWYNSHQSNRLMADGLATLQVYSPLAPQRLNRYLGLARENPSVMVRLLELASVEYALDTESRMYSGLEFIVKRPLAEIGLWRDAQADITLPTQMQATRVRLIFTQTGWPALETDELAQVSLVGEDGQERSWVLRDESVTVMGPGQVPVRLITQPVLRDPLSWHSEDFTVQERPLYYAEINPTLSTPVTRVTVAPWPETTLYLLGLSIESADGQWVAGEQPFHQDGFDLFHRHPRGAIYRVANALPRAYVVHQVCVVPDSQALQALLDPAFDPQQEALVTDGPKPTLGLRVASNSDVHILDYRPTRVDIAVDLAAPGLLVLTDLNYPGWQVFVDGVQQSVVSTNYLFRGVYVGKGLHHVTFVYQPVSIRIGMAITLAMITGMIGLMMIEMVHMGRRDMRREE